MLPLFFIPECQVMSHDVAIAHGLDRLFGTKYQSVQTMRGPGGVTGMIVASLDTPVDRLRFAGDEQTWSPRYGYKSLVGTWNDALPTVDELQRDTLLQGEQVELLDGSIWNIPILRAWRDTDTLVEYDILLPRVLQQCAETGRWVVSAVVPQYAELWNASMRIAQKLFDQLQGKESAELDHGELFDFAIALLQVNYRIDASVVSHLRVLAPDLAAEIVRCALDWNTLRRNLKNALSRLSSGGTNTESGATPPTEA